MFCPLRAARVPPLAAPRAAPPTVNAVDDAASAPVRAAPRSPAPGSSALIATTVAILPIGPNELMAEPKSDTTLFKNPPDDPGVYVKFCEGLLIGVVAPVVGSTWKK